MVEIVAAEVRVTIRRKYFEHTTAELEDRDIERTTTEVEDSNLHVFLRLVETVGQSGCRRLVHDSLDVEASDLSGFFRSLALRVGEVGRHGDDSLRHLLSEVILGRFLHLLKNHGRDFLRRIKSAVNVDTGRIVIPTHHGVRHTLHLFRHLVVGFAHEAFD